MSLAYRVLFAGSFDFYPSLFEKLSISNSVLCVSRCQFGGWQLVVGGWQLVSSWATSTGNVFSFEIPTALALPPHLCHRARLTLVPEYS